MVAVDVELIAGSVPWRIPREVLARAGAGEVGIRPQREHLHSHRIEARAGNLAVGKWLSGERVLDGGCENALTFKRRGDDDQVALSLALVEPLPTEEEESLVTPHGSADRGDEQV